MGYTYRNENKLLPNNQLQGNGGESKSHRSLQQNNKSWAHLDLTFQRVTLCIWLLKGIHFICWIIRKIGIHFPFFHSSNITNHLLIRFTLYNKKGLAKLLNSRVLSRSISMNQSGYRRKEKREINYTLSLWNFSLIIPSITPHEYYTVMILTR